MKRIKKILKALISVLVFIILSFIIFTLITSKTDTIGHIRSFVVLTGSMQPVVPQGSIVYVQKRPFYNKGAIIAFKNASGQTITHRIVKKFKTDNGIFYQTKGDANNTFDEKLVPHKDVIGKSELTIPYIGRFALFLKTLPGFIIFVFLPIALFIAHELYQIKKELEKNIEKKIMERMQTV